MFGDYLLVALRLTFGGAPGPSLWSVISEVITDIGNSLLQNNCWDHTTLFDHVSNGLETPISITNDTPLAKARAVSVPIPANDNGRIDIFIDDSIGVAPEIGDAPLRLIRAIPLAIRTVSRPLTDDDFVPRKDIISLKKLKAEGQLSEVKTILGWIVNTHSLTISLPQQKATTWIADISAIIESGRADFKALECLLGRLNHVACIMSPMRHFMGRLYAAMFRAKAGNNWTVLHPRELQDLALHAECLEYASRGFSLNNVTYRQPTHIFRSDACEFGMGGYNPASGRAWRWEIPVDLRYCTSVNSLEFLACLITLWIDIDLQNIGGEDCILSQTDSTTAAGWLRKSNFSDNSDEFIQLASARHLASLLLKSKSCIYSQWFSGDVNCVADSLSRDFHLEASHLASLLVRSYPEQAPFGLEIHPLPSSIVSWVTSLLQSQQPTKPWSGEQMRSKLALGLASRPTCSPLESNKTCTSMDLTQAFVTRYSVPLPKPSERVDFLLQQPSFSRPTQLEPPWISWHRPSSWQAEQTPAWTPMESLHTFYSASFEDISQPTLERNLRQL